MPEANDILDPAHDPNDTGTNAGAAGIPSPEKKEPEKPAERVSEDGNIIERDGKKYIVFDALQQERGKRQKAESTLAALEPVLPEFNEFLKTRENRRAAVKESVAATDDKDDPEYLNEVAIALGFFNEQNEPDLRRAQAHLNISRREATRVAERTVRPVAENTAREQARMNRERNRSARFVDGQPVADEKYLEAAAGALPEEMLADPQVASLIQVIGAGLQYLDERKTGTARRGGSPAPRRGEPMHVERGTGRYDGDDGEVSALDLAAARARGKSIDEWKKMSNRVNASRNVLDEV